MTEELKPIKQKIELEVEFDTTQKEVTPSRFSVLLDFADVIDAYRLFPRAFIATYLFLLIDTAEWFMTIPEPNASQAGLISVIIGAGAAWFGLYTSTGSGRSSKSTKSN
jgi:hypothetical protein|tara:strand:- start:6407 stop:6733 length:327 start_codon:yes stop_codon:yes gene_type:complete